MNPEVLISKKEPSSPVALSHVNENVARSKSKQNVEDETNTVDKATMLMARRAAGTLLMALDTAFVRLRIVIAIVCVFIFLFFKIISKIILLIFFIAFLKNSCID